MDILSPPLTANRGKYAKGSAALTYRDYELEVDRSAEFAFDRHDVDETSFIVQAPAVMGEFQRSQVVPEIDAFRYSRIASLVMAQGAGAYGRLWDHNKQQDEKLDDHETRITVIEKKA